jgi:hypothetical protein
LISSAKRLLQQYLPLATHAPQQIAVLFDHFVSSNKARNGVATEPVLRLLGKRTLFQWAEPFPDLLINFRPIQQFHVVYGASDPLAGFRQREITARFLVLSERAVDRHEPVADNRASNPRAGDPRNRVTPHVWWQRHDLTRVANMIEPIVALPILVDNVAVAKIGDAGTAHAAETREGVV